MMVGCEPCDFFWVIVANLGIMPTTVHSGCLDVNGSILIHLGV